MKKLALLLITILAVCMLGGAMAEAKFIPALPGSDVALDLNLTTGEPSVAVLEFKYDKNTLEFINATIADGIISGVSDGKVALARLDPMNGVVGTLNFKVKASAKDGTTDITFNTEQAFDSNEKAVTVKAKQGGVDVTSDKVQAYVKRCYYLLMDRDADKGGLDYWSDGLKAKERDASEIVWQFLTSPEYQGAHGKDNDYTITCLYKAMLGREPEAGGYSYWLDRLEKNGIADVLDTYCTMPEFTDICDTYGINPGSGSGQGSQGEEPVGTGVEGFVQRCYTKALDRSFDQGGVDYWVAEMKKGLAPQEVAKKFIFSEEALGKGRSNDEFIKTLYRLYMGREADDAGLAYWNGKMAEGMSLEQVNDGFAGSEEFAAIVAGFGL